MTPRELAQEIINAAYDRRHDDVARFVARLVALAEAALRPPPAPIEPSD